MSVAENIQKELERKGLKPADLVRLSGVPQGRLSQILSGKTKNPRGDTISKLAAGLNVSEGKLLGCETIKEIDQPQIEETPVDYITTNYDALLDEALRYMKPLSDHGKRQAVTVIKGILRKELNEEK